MDLDHGTYTAYTNGKCRCRPCRDAASAYMREYRKTTKGKTAQRYYTNLSVKRASLAAKWIRENRPDIWAIINAEAESMMGDKPVIPADRSIEA